MLDLPCALQEVLRHDPDGEYHQRNREQAQQHEDHVLVLDREVDQGADRAHEDGRLLERLVRRAREGHLELVGVGHAARDQVAGGVAVKERQRQSLELAEIVDAQPLEHAEAAVVDEVLVEVTGHAADQEHRRQPQCVAQDLHVRELRGALGEHLRKHELQHERHAKSTGGTEHDGANERADELRANGPQVAQVRLETLQHRLCEPLRGMPAAMFATAFINPSRRGRRARLSGRRRGS